VSSVLSGTESRKGGAWNETPTGRERHAEKDIISFSAPYTAPSEWIVSELEFAFQR
jgi:hypothetical protein